MQACPPHPVALGGWAARPGVYAQLVRIIFTHPDSPIARQGQGRDPGGPDRGDSRRGPLPPVRRRLDGWPGRPCCTKSPARTAAHRPGPGGGPPARRRAAAGAGAAMTLFLGLDIFDGDGLRPDHALRLKRGPASRSCGPGKVATKAPTCRWQHPRAGSAPVPRPAGERRRRAECWRVHHAQRPVAPCRRAPGWRHPWACCPR